MRIPRLNGETGGCQDDVIGNVAAAVRQIQFGSRQTDRLTGAGQSFRLYQHIFELCAVTTSVHHDAAADRPGNRDKKLKPAELIFRGIAGHVTVSATGFGAQLITVVVYLVHMGGQMNDNPFNTAVPDQ